MKSRLEIEAQARLEEDKERVTQFVLQVAEGEHLVPEDLDRLLSRLMARSMIEAMRIFRESANEAIDEMIRETERDLKRAVST